MKIGIVGSRRRDTKIAKDTIRNEINSLISEGIIIDCFVSGGCKKGADKFAEELALEFNVPIKIFLPDVKGKERWDYAKACYARNTLVAQDSDILIAVVAEDRKGGTEDTIKKFKDFKKHTLGARLILL